VTRTPLPTRRQNRLADIQHEGRRYTVCIGYDAAGQPKEVFVDGAKEGSGMRAILSDACILVSIALQYGAQPFELRHSLGLVPAFHEGKPTEVRASLIGVLVDALVPLETAGG
jgi:hypothetical protein